MSKVEINKLKIGDVIDDAFDCGDSQFNAMIKNSYFANLCRQIYIYDIKIDNRLLGYLAFSVARVDVNFSESFEKDNSYKYPGIINLEYIAIDKNFQKKGIGTASLDNFICYIRNISKTIPIAFITLEPLPGKEEWYKKKYFEFDNEIMYLDLKDDEERKIIEENIRMGGAL